MANWSTLKTAVADIINTNGNQAITGQLLQNVLNNIITNVGENSTFAGIATVDTNPGAPDGPVFYLATTAGIYPNFNSIEVLDGEAVILEWDNSTWTKKVTGFATQEKLSELGSEVKVLFIPPTLLEFNYIERNSGVITNENKWGRFTDDLFAHIAIKVKGGDRITYRASSNNCYGAFLQKYNPFDSVISFSAEDGYNGRFYMTDNVATDYIVPMDANYLIITIRFESDTDDIPHIFKYNGIDLLESHAERVNQNTDSIKKITPKVESNGRYVDVVEDGYININNGKTINSSIENNTVYCPIYFKVNSGVTYILRESNKFSYAIYLYDNDKNYIGYDRYFKGSNIVSINGGVGYIRIAIRALNGTLTKDSYNDNIWIDNYKLSTTDIFNGFQCGKLSIIGDSISTYDGTGIDGYNMYYPREDVDHVSKTYWGRLLMNGSGTLEVNASYSGSCVSSNRNSVGYPSLCDRVSLLGNPDTIIIALGTNDSNNEVPIGEFTYDADMDSLDESYFASAYIKGVKMIQQSYPEARIICLIFMDMAQLYRNAIKDIASHFSLECVDIKYFESLGDEKHPSFKGMVYIANRLSNIETDGKIEGLTKASEDSKYSAMRLDSTVGEALEQPLGITHDAKYVGTDGSVKSSTSLYGIYHIDVKAGTQIQFTSYTTSSVAPIAKFDGENYVPLVLGKTESGLYTYTFNVDSDSTIALSGRIGSTSITLKNLYFRVLNFATKDELDSLSLKLIPTMTNESDEVNQIADGVATNVSTSTRHVYYKEVKKGDKIALKGSITNSTKPVEWALYKEIPSESSVAVVYGKVNMLGDNIIYPSIVEDGYIAFAINISYNKNWGMYKITSFSDFELGSAKLAYLPSKIKFIPHRGLRNAEIPESTTYSVMFAALYGLKHSECDVRYTSDGVGVVMHDTTINRTMYNFNLSAISEDVTIVDNTYETLSQYVYRSTNEIYRTKLQTIKEYIDACAQWDICPIIQGSMSDEDLAYCMQRLGDNWICYGGNFAKVREFSNNVLCLTSASYSSVETMVESLKSIGGNVGLSRLYNSELTDEYIAACKSNGFEVMASFAYQHVNIPDAIRRGVTIVLSDNVGKETNKVLASSIFGWDKFAHDGNVINGKLVLNSNLSYKLSGKGNYKIYAQFEGEGTITLPDYNNKGVYGSLDFPMNNRVFIYTFAQLEDSDFTLRINKSSDLVLERLIVSFEEVKI